MYQQSKIEDGEYISDVATVDILKWSTENNFNAIEFFNEIDIKLYKQLWLYANFGVQFGNEKFKDSLLGSYESTEVKFNLLENIGLKFKF